jgi:hypothetical protein
MKPVPDDPRFLYVLDTFWREFKSIDWQNFEIYPIIGIAAITALLLICFLLRAWKGRTYNQ